MKRDKDLDLNTSGDLPMGSSMQGATRSSMGGLKASDIERGFGDGEYHPEQTADDGTASNPVVCDLPQPYGFLGRVQGWER